MTVEPLPPIAPLRLSYNPIAQAWSLQLECDTTADAAISATAHEPNGYFWQGVAQFLVATHPRATAYPLREGEVDGGQIDYDPEGSMFVAYGTDRAALVLLGELMAEVANDGGLAQKVVEEAERAGFEFDD